MISAKQSKGSTTPVDAFDSKTNAMMVTFIMSTPLKPALEMPIMKAAKKASTHCHVECSANKAVISNS